MKSYQPASFSSAALEIPACCNLETFARITKKKESDLLSGLLFEAQIGHGNISVHQSNEFYKLNHVQIMNTNMATP